jgi:signal transduction histidine kinase
MTPERSTAAAAGPPRAQGAYDAPAAAPSYASGWSETPSALGSIRALLVEDNVPYARMLEAVLHSYEPARFQVTRATHLDQALSKVQDLQPDVILLDLWLPDSEGIPTFSAMQAAAPNVPIVVLTGRDDSATSLQVMNAGAQDYVLKGEVSEGLVARIAVHAVERHRLLAADKERILELQALFRIATILSGPGTLADNAAKVLNSLVETVGLDRAVLRQLDPTGTKLVRLASSGPLSDQHPPSESVDLAIAGGVSARAFTSGQVVIENHHRPGGRTGRTFSGPATLSAIALPISVGADQRAVLHVGSRYADFFHAGRVALLTAIARSLGVLIGNAELRQHLSAERALNERKDNFISIASHELRTPMTIMLGLSEMLLEKEPGKEERQSWYGMISRETRRLATIVDEMLDVSEINAGAIRLAMESVSIVDLARSLAEEMAPQMPKHELRIEPGDGVPSVWADRGKLSQVLRNLLDNAFKFSPQGGAIKVSFQYRPSSASVVTSVSDEGIGIATADRKHLFNTFTRGSQSEITAIRGTGLGLFIVRSLLDYMDGRIWLTSRPGRGSTFHFELPAAVNAPRAAA